MVWLERLQVIVAGVQNKSRKWAKRRIPSSQAEMSARICRKELQRHRTGVNVSPREDERQ